MKTPEKVPTSPKNRDSSKSILDDSDLSPIKSKGGRKIEIPYLIRALRLSKNLSEVEDDTIKDKTKHYSLIYQLIVLGELFKIYQQDTTQSHSKVKNDTQTIINSLLGASSSIATIIGEDIRDRLLHSGMLIADFESDLIDCISKDRKSFNKLSEVIDHTLAYRIDREFKKILKEFDSQRTTALNKIRN